MVSSAIRHARASAASLSRSGVRIYSSRSIQAARGTAAQTRAAAAGRAATSASGVAAAKQRLRDAATLKAAKLKEEVRVRAAQVKAAAEKALEILRISREEELAKREEEAAKEEEAKTKAEIKCPKGLYYDAKWYLQCASGYVEYSLKGHNKCVCVMRIAEAKAQLDALYAKDDLTENGEGIGFFGDLFGMEEKKDKISGIIILVVIAVVVVALIGMLKKQK